MKNFAALIYALDQTNKTNNKLDLLTEYFNSANDKDKLWTLAIFNHRRPSRPINRTLIRQYAQQLSGIPAWLFDESYSIVGDLSETIALLLPQPTMQHNKSLSEWMNEIVNIKAAEELEKKQWLTNAWMGMNKTERFAFNKFLTGSFRIGVSAKTVQKALARATSIDEAGIAHRLMGKWTPTTTTFNQLIIEHNEAADDSKPYPFYLAYPLTQEPSELGEIEKWQVEWKWDGIRGQIIKRNDEAFVWSRGEELVTDKYPEYEKFISNLPNGIVLDGEILPYNNHPLPFSALQKRIGRKKVSKKLMEEVPVIFMVYDVLEHEGEDVRSLPLNKRREIIERLPLKKLPNLKLSTMVKAKSWLELAQMRETSRANFAEGFMIKNKESTYKVGRKKGDWWKWKVDPLTIDAVMIYAQRGSGRRANLYTDYTFAVKDGDKLVPFAKAYSGLTDEEFRKVNQFIRKNTLDRFGPVRSVKPELVFEIGFEGIAKSNRHKSGIALRFPRMLKWRTDKDASEINTLADLQKLLEIYGN